MLYEKLDITKPTGHHDFHNYYSNLYIMDNTNATGYIIINESEKINIEDIDLIEDIPSGIHSIEWSINSGNFPIQVIVSTVHLKPKQLIFKTEETLPVNVTNPTFDINPVAGATFVVDQATSSVWDISVTNASMDVNVTNTTIDVSITNSTLDVIISNTTAIDVNIANTSLDVAITNATLDVAISDATVTLDTAIADLNVVWPGAQLDYNYTIFYSVSNLNLEKFPFVSASGPSASKQLINLPDAVLVDPATLRNGVFVLFKYPLYRPTTDILYSGDLDTLVPPSYTAGATAPPTDFYSTTIDLGTSIATLQGLYLIIEMKIHMTTTSTGNGWIVADFQGSNDQVTWTTLKSIFLQGTSTIGINSGGYYGINVTNKYQYYRFYYHVVTTTTDITSYGYTYGIAKVIGWTS